jgi:8-oxo-dGTP pyrophosphatase MutT (NUDIX family)
VKFRSDREGHPEDTAARELEEETHGIIAAADSRVVLPYCPVMYSPETKMVVYFMRYIGAGRLPDLMEQRLAGKAQPFGVLV